MPEAQEQQYVFDTILNIIQSIDNGQITKEDENHAIHGILAMCSKHCARHGKPLYIYFDQHNAITDELLQKSPYSYAGIQPIRCFAQAGGVMVICVSAINSPIKTPILFTGASRFQYISQYSDEDMETLIRQALPPLEPEDDDDAQLELQFQRAAVLTNKIPLEVTQLQKVIHMTLAQAAGGDTATSILDAANREFYRDRVYEMRQIEDRFVATLTSVERDEYIRSKMWMTAGARNGAKDEPAAPTKINQLLMYSLRTAGEPYFLPLSPAAEEAMRQGGDARHVRSPCSRNTLQPGIHRRYEGPHLRVIYHGSVEGQDHEESGAGN